VRVAAVTARHQNADLPRPASLDDKSAHEWGQLSAQVLDCRRAAACSRVNVTLESAAKRDPQSPAATVFRLWMADNLLRDGEFAQALAAYDVVLERAQSAERLIKEYDPIPGVLHHKAHAAAMLGDIDTALATWQELARYVPGSANAYFQAGLLAHSSGRTDQAAELYRQAARGDASNRTDDAAELARRELLRMALPSTAFAENERQLAGVLADALERGDARLLQALLTSTHFAVGTVGGHTVFEQDDLIEALWTNLKSSEIKVRRTLLGSGGKRYLHTEGWRGKWFSGPVIFLLTRGPRGWQWTGVAIAGGSALWVERWRPAVLQKNQPLPFELYAPWPEGQCFMAGGFNEFLVQQTAILAAAAGGGFLFGSLAAAAVAFAFSTQDCGFGVRGFYFNQFTHVDDDAFAIDFTRYRQYVPYDNESGGTPVLAARSGIVSYVYDTADTGDPNNSNTVYIDHEDPANPGDKTRFRSHYLHMEGLPGKVTVSFGMPVYTGNRLGYMDDTGNSVLDHLHFSIHDRELLFNGQPYASVRPTPMSGVRLGDDDSGRCVCSTNTEYEGEKPMIEATTFDGQNWLITPAALSVNESEPSVQDQKFLLVLSGVVIVDIKGNSGAQWRRETVSIRPDLFSPLQYAVSRHGIPTPPGSSGTNYQLWFEVEQWAPFAAVSSMFNEHESVNSGFAVDRWRPNPFVTATGFNNTTLDRLFSGIQVDVAVRDTDAWLHRVSYSVVLLGRVRFAPILIL
jgi:hypothetical protein